MADPKQGVSPNEQRLRIAKSAIGAVVLMCAWVAVAEVLPGPRYELADDLRAQGSTVITGEVTRHVDTGRGLHVSDVEVTFRVDGRTVTTRLAHVRDIEADDEIVPRDGPDWGSGPYEWWEGAEEIPPGSRYAPPVVVRYLPDQVDLAMAQADLDALLAQGRSSPAAAVLFLPLAVALLVPPVRRVAFRRHLAS